MTKNPFKKPQKSYFIHRAIVTMLSLSMICISSTCQNPGVLQERIETLEATVNKQGSNTNDPPPSGLADMLLKVTTLQTSVTTIGNDIKDIKNGKILSQHEWNDVEAKLMQLRIDHDNLKGKVPNDLEATLGEHDKLIKDYQTQLTALQTTQAAQATAQKDLKEAQTALQAALTQAQKEAQNNLDTVIEALKKDLEAKINNAPKGISQTELDALKIKLDQKLEDELGKLDDKFKKEVEGVKTKAETELAAAREYLLRKIKQVTPKQQQHARNLAKAQKDFNDKMDARKAESDKNLQKAKMELRKEIKAAESKLRKEFADRLAKLTSQNPAPESGLQNDVDKLKEEMKALIEDKQADETKEALKDLNARIAKFEADKAALEQTYKQKLQEAEDKLAKQMDEQQAGLQSFQKDLQAKIEDLSEGMEREKKDLGQVQKALEARIESIKEECKNDLQEVKTRLDKQLKNELTKLLGNIGIRKLDDMSKRFLEWLGRDSS